MTETNRCSTNWIQTTRFVQKGGLIRQWMCRKHVGRPVTYHHYCQSRESYRDTSSIHQHSGLGIERLLFAISRRLRLKVRWRVCSSNRLWKYLRRDGLDGKNRTTFRLIIILHGLNWNTRTDMTLNIERIQFVSGNGWIYTHWTVCFSDNCRVHLKKIDQWGL